MTNTYEEPEGPPGGVDGRGGVDPGGVDPGGVDPGGVDPVVTDPVVADPVMAGFAARLDEIMANERAMSTLAARRIRLFDGLRRFSEIYRSKGSVAGLTRRAATFCT